MNCFFDTSALIKNYIEETGSEKVSALMEEADEIFVSKITIIECFSTLKRILSERLISKSDYIRLKKEILYDFE
ncbi:MAG: VapC toxin family PIN domain ribonuclease, partial [Spirochaetes bacterium]